MDDPAIDDKMRREWNERAQKGYMQYTGGVRTGMEDDYVQAGRRDADTILKYLGGEDTKAWKALDVGCGAGRILQHLAPRFGEVHGVDVSDEMIKLAGERVQGQTNVKLHRVEGSDLKAFADRSFNFAWSYSVFYHVPRTVYYSYLQELSRVLLPGARLIYQMAQLYSLRRWLQAVFRVEPDAQDTNRRRFFTKGHFRELADRYGFEILSMEPGNSHDLWCQWRKK